MTQNRIEQLLQFLKEDPNDPFVIYALAIEYMNFDSQEALKYFNKLLKDHENYVGTYYHAADLLQKLGKREQAEEVYAKGIKVCEANNKLHALKELKNAYQNFLYNDE